jgi:hypothetical protein
MHSTDAQSEPRNMMLGTPSQPQLPNQMRYLERQVNEILDLILSAVKFQSIQDLISICRVSRKFYLLAVPHLYRETSFDLNRASHLRLLHRLEHPGCGIPRIIRRLAVLSVEEKHIDELFRIGKLIVATMGNLKELEWQGTLCMLVPIVETLHIRCPGIRLSLRAMKTKKSFETSAINKALRPVLIHPTVARVLTRFEIVLGEHSIYYHDFKGALVAMLTSNSVLTHLQIVAKNIVERRFPENLGTAGFRGKRLPKLKELRLYVDQSSVFTDDELQYWGRQGGFDQITFLGLCHAHSFITFIGRTPKLDQLWLLPRNVNEIDDLESFLKDSTIEHPFGELRHLKMQIPVINGIPTEGTRRVVPWCMLKQLPPDQLKTLDISHPHSDVGHALNVPRAQDIRDIRNLCSALEEFQVDILLPGNLCPWPYDVFRELVAFDRLIKLTLILRMGYTPTRYGYLSVLIRGSKYLLCYVFKIGKTLRKERERLRISGQTHFTVQCGHVSYGPGSTEVTKPTKLWYSFDISGTDTKFSLLPGDRKHNRLDKMSLEKMHERKDQWVLNAWVPSRLPFNGSDYKRELKRRADHELLVRMVAKGHMIDITLYDYWTQSELVGRNS